LQRSTGNGAAAIRTYPGPRQKPALSGAILYHCGFIVDYFYDAMRRHLQICLFLIAATSGDSALAGKLLDYLRDYDLNDYALGLSISASENPYLDGENSTILYPYLTSFRDSAFTRDWLLIRDGDLGIRWVSPSEWELGLVGRIQTLGFGTTDSPRLGGLDDRQWGLEMGPIIGYRGWPVHINFKAYTEILGRHGGLTGELRFSLPWEHDRGFVVPSIGLIAQDADYANYYYGVAPRESNLLRPAYRPGGTLNASLKLRMGYAITDKWLLDGSIGLEYLDSAISASPIVERDRLLSASISLAYNNDIFQPRVSSRPAADQPRFELRFGAFADNIDTQIVRDSSAGGDGGEIDVEDVLGMSDNETLLHVDALYRIGHYHRLEFGYLQTSRKGRTTLQEPVEYGDQVFPAGTVINSLSESTIYRIGYAYSLINDPQKEVGVMGGLHFTRMRTRIGAFALNLSESSNVATPLPVIGLHGALALGANSTLGARIQFFRMDFQSYEGLLNFATLDWQRRLGNGLRLGLAYNYYALKLDSRDNDVRGSLAVRHHGPELFVNLSF